MPFFDGILMRDTIGDDGTVPSPGYPYSSPDMICYQQVANPKTFFAGNYGTDPNQPVQLGSALNFLYVRGKNLSSTPLTGWRVFVYRASSSLFMNTNIWRNNPLSTASGAGYVIFDTVQPGAVVVGDDNFLLSGLANNLFCLVGIASSTPAPVIPAPFTNYSDYVLWVRQNQNVCGRNLTVARSFANRQYERLDSFSNPETQSVPTLFVVKVTGSLPAGTTFGITCAPLGVDASWNISQGTRQTASGFCPAGFNGTVTTWASLPSGGSSWPPGAQVSTTTYVGRDANDPAARYATSFRRLRLHRRSVTGLAPQGVLVQVGNCATLFVSQ